MDLVTLIADRELAPYAAGAEEAHAFPRDAFRTLGRAGLMGLPYPVDVGGGGQPYEVYLHVLELLAPPWASVRRRCQHARFVMFPSGVRRLTRAATSVAARDVR